MADLNYSEIQSNLPDLDIKQFQNWRDFILMLQQGQTQMPDKNLDSSSDMGGQGFRMASRTLINLREGRIDNNGDPYILCADEFSDTEVISNASQEDITKAFIPAFIAESRRRSMESIQSRANDHATMAVALGNAMTGISAEDMKNVLLAATANMLPENKLGKALEVGIRTTSETNVKQIIEYLKFSQTQLTDKEKYFINTGLKEYAEIGSEPIDIDGETYYFENEGSQGISLTQEDDELLIPLRGANHRSRQDMIDQAKVLTEQIFGVEIEDGFNPPKDWFTRENFQPIKSNEYLVFLPYKKQTSINSAPHLFQVLYENTKNRGGWYLIDTKRDDSNALVLKKIGHLNN
jgi:hypothetical protein